jgi:hypothetical protein
MIKFILPSLALGVCLASSPSFADTSAPAVPPPSPQAGGQITVAPAEAPAGQWVYTSQYGWLWMPYEQAYTYVDAESDVSYGYVYYPAFGWRWVLAPWVFGLGPEPRWGTVGRARFAWYAHPWFHGRGGAYHGAAYRGPAFEHSGGERAYHGGSTFHGGGTFHGAGTFHGGGGGHGHR